MRETLGAVVVALSLVLPSSPGLASDVLIEGARQCTQYFPTAEKRHGIPNHLLAAISSAESGRWHSGLEMPVPWPWTINAEGQGYYFNSKAEAIAKTAALMRAGKRSIDVGCMQVSLKHHPNAFASLNDAFDPAQNVEYAAKFLRANYDDLGDWVKATAAYHSRTPYYGSRYLSLIERTWNRIVAKVQQARSRGGHVAMKPEAPKFREYRAQLAKTTVPQAGGVASRPIASTRGVKVVSVKDAPSQKPDVLVIRPNNTSPIKVADASSSPVVPADTGPVVVQSTPEAVKRLDVGASTGTSAPSTGATSKFVFAN